MKIITKVEIIHDDEIIEVAKFVRNDDGHLEVEFAEEGTENDVLDRLEEMTAFVRENLE